MNTTRSYRITNDGGDCMASRPWHVETNIGNGWGLRAVCETRDNAEKHIACAREDRGEDEAMMLGNFN